MGYTLLEQTASPKVHCDIRRRTGLTPKSVEAAEKALPHTIYGVSIINDEDQSVIGMGRLVGDGHLFLQVVDIGVLPEHQKKGLGRRIMEALMDWIDKNTTRDCHVNLLAVGDAHLLYQKFGFIPSKQLSVIRQYPVYDRAPFHVRIVKFGCLNCGRRWQSANGSLQDYQRCKGCLEKTFPSSYKIQAPNKRGNENPGTFRPHNSDLCGKCDRLGYSCMEIEGDEGQDDIIVVAADEEDVVLTKANDLSNFIVVKEKKTKKSKPKKEDKAGTTSKGGKKSGPKQLFEDVKKPALIYMKQDEEISKSTTTQKTLDALESEVALLKVTEKLPKSDLYYYKNDDLLDTSKYSYDLDEQKMFEQHFLLQQIAAGSN
ncbi:hypothetical protein MBANPS3_008857 [Mucor bainieri]